MEKRISQHRAKWSALALKNRWGDGPFYIQIWLDSAGNILESWSSRSLKGDAFITSSNNKRISKRNAKKLMKEAGTWDE